MGKNKGPKEEKAPVFKLGIEKNVEKSEPKIIIQVEKELHNSIEDLIADNKAEIAYLETRQREQELEIKNRQENVKRLQEEKKAIRREERERQKFYNSLKREDIGLTKIDVPRNKASNLNTLVNTEEPLIKRKQNHLVKEDEKNRLKNEYRTSLFYPDDKEETKQYYEKQKQVAEKQRQEQKAQLEKQVEARNNANPLPISDVEKTLFPNGNLAEMDFAKAKELGENINDFNKNFQNFLKIINMLPSFQQMKEATLYSIKNKEETKNAMSQFFVDIGKGYICDNAIAINFIQNIGIRNYAISEIGKEAAENLYMAKKEYYMNTPYAREHQLFNNCYELEPRLRDYFIEKITQQIGADELETTKGIYIDANSQSSKAISMQEELQDIILANINALKKGAFIEKIDTLKFKSKNFHNAINNADILDLHINKQGNIDLLVVDTYDFNKNESIDLIKLAREHQDRGDLVPYFIIYHVEFPIYFLKDK